MSMFQRKTEVDRRGRIFVDGIFFDFEDEIETLKALFIKYPNVRHSINPPMSASTPVKSNEAVPYTPVDSAVYGS